MLLVSRLQKLFYTSPKSKRKIPSDCIRKDINVVITGITNHGKAQILENICPTPYQANRQISRNQFQTAPFGEEHSLTLFHLPPQREVYWNMERFADIVLLVLPLDAPDWLPATEHLYWDQICLYKKFTGKLVLIAHQVGSERTISEQRVKELAYQINANYVLETSNFANSGFSELRDIFTEIFYAQPTKSARTI